MAVLHMFVLTLFNDFSHSDFRHFGGLEIDFSGRYASDV